MLEQLQNLESSLGYIDLQQMYKASLNTSLRHLKGQW